MKIRSKITIPLLIIVLAAGTLGSFVIDYYGKKTLQDTIGESSVLLAQETIDKIDRTIESRIEQASAYALDTSAESYFLENNRDFEDMENRAAYIQEIDSQWSSESEEILPFVEDLTNNEMSQEIRDEFQLSDFYIQRYGHDVFPEVFVTNKYGANVAQTGKTSDYYQADEDWWQKAREEDIYVENVEYDSSADMLSLIHI